MEEESYGRDEIYLAKSKSFTNQEQYDLIESKE